MAVLLPTSARVHWLLDLTWGGKVYRLSEEDLDVASEDGTTLRYEGGLSPVTLEESLALLGDSGGQASVSIECLLPCPEGVPTLVAEGHDLSLATAELSRWIEGDDYEDRVPKLRGKVVDPEWGEADEPVAFTLEEISADDSSLTHHPNQVVDGNTWAHADSLLTENLGLEYPIIFGTPGRVSFELDMSGWVTGAPALWAWCDPAVTSGAFRSGLVLVIAGHHVNAERVYINTEPADLDADGDTDGDALEGVRVCVRNGHDLLGQPIAYIPWYYSVTGTSEVWEYDSAGTYLYLNSADFDGDTTWALGDDVGPSASAEDPIDIANNGTQPAFYVGWLDDESPNQGGMVRDGKLVCKAGDVIEVLLGMTTRSVDTASCQANRHLISRFRIDACIEVATKPWDWIRDNLLTILPISITSGPDGFYYEVHTVEPVVADAEIHFDADADPDIDFDGRIEEDTSDLYSQVTLEYAYSYRTQNYLGKVTFGPAKDDPGIDPAESVRTYQPHPYCDIAREILGTAVEKAIKTVVVYEDLTAWGIGETLLPFYCLPRQRAFLKVTEAKYIHSARGQACSVTASRYGLDQRPGIVERVITDGSGVLGVLVWFRYQPRRDLHPARAA